MTPFRRHLSRKVEFARDAIVTWIHDRKLEVGDRLPPYSQLRLEFGLGSQTIAAAVGSLCELGVLEVRDKVGIFVKNPSGGHLAGRTVAVAVRRLVGSSYAAMLAGFIQKLLSAHLHLSYRFGIIRNTNLRNSINNHTCRTSPITFA